MSYFIVCLFHENLVPSQKSNKVVNSIFDLRIIFSDFLKTLVFQASPVTSSGTSDSHSERLSQHKSHKLQPIFPLLSAALCAEEVVPLKHIWRLTWESTLEKNHSLANYVRKPSLKRAICERIWKMCIRLRMSKNM